MKKILCLTLCLLFCVSTLVGCGGLEEDEKGANIRMFLTDYPYTLDPAVVQLNSDVDQILSLIFEPLTTIDEDGKVKEGLATEWYYDYDEIYQEHKMYFELKETSWSDNRAVSADDVIYAWRRILSPETDSPYASLLFAIKGAREVKSGVGTIDDLGLAAVDDTLLEVTFEKETFGGEYVCDLFARQVSNIHLAPCREDIVTRCEKLNEDWAGSAANMVCNGKFRVQSMDMPRAKKDGEQDFNSNFTCKLVLERNSYYMREDDQALDKYVDPYRITCYYFEGQTEYYEEDGNTQEAFQANRFMNGELFYLSSFEKQTYEFFKNSKDYDLETYQTLNGYAFYFNTQNEILKDANVRKALSAVLDRTAITTDATGTGEVPATGYVPNGVFNTENKTSFREVGGNIYNASSDMDKAREYLSSAAKKSGKLKVAYLIPQNSYTIKNYGKKISYVNKYESIARKAGEYWEQLGFSIDYVGLDPDAYLQALVSRNYDIIGVNINGGSADAFGYLAPFAKEYSGTGVVVDTNIANDQEVFNTHYTNYDNAAYSEIITNALKASSLEERANLLHQAETMLADECPATMVFWYTNSFVASDEISGYEVNSFYGFTDFTKLKLDDWREVNSKETEVSMQRAG